MAKKYEKKELEIKFTMGEGEGETGSFSGYLSIFGVIDSYGDVVKKGAFKKSIKDKKEFPLLWSHDIFEPIGVFTATEDEKGLLIQGKLNLDVQRARELRSLMAQGAVKGLSIGFRVIDSKPMEQDGVQIRLLREIDLWEGSPCVFQACPEAEVDQVKGAIFLLDRDERGEVQAYIESLSALLGKVEPPAGTPKASPPQEPPPDSDLAPYYEAAKSAIQEMRGPSQVQEST